MRTPLAAALGLTAACVPVAEPPALSGVEFVCDDVLASDDGPTCVLQRGGAASVRVWVPGEAPLLAVDGTQGAPHELRSVGEGSLMTIDLPEGAGELTLTRVGPRPGRWRLLFVWEARADGDAVADAFGEGRWHDCQRLAEEAYAAAQAERRPLRALQAIMSGAMCSAQRGDKSALWRWLAEVEQVPASPGFGELRRDEIRGTLLQHEGALHDALAALDRGLERSERLGATGLHAQLLTTRALTLIELGDFPGAIAAARAALDRGAHPYLGQCEEAVVRSDIAWALITSAERGDGAAWTAATVELEAALRIAASPAEECPREYVSAVRLNLARTALARRDAREAARWLDAAAAGLGADASVDLRAELVLLRARLGLITGAVDDVGESLARVDATVEPDLLLEAETLRGELAEARGELARAEADYARAHRRTLQRLGGLAHDHGAHRFVFDRLEATRGFVRLLVARDAAHEAARVVREVAGAEARLLARRREIVTASWAAAAERRLYLDARAEHERLLVERWDLRPSVRARLAADASRRASWHGAALYGDGVPAELVDTPLRKPPESEVLLSFFPITNDALLGFGITGSDVVIAPIAGVGRPPAATSVEELLMWSERLLAPFAAMIDGAAKVRVLPSFGWQALPFHAMPWRGRSLIDHVAVEYGLDLPPRDRGDVRASASALVVGDPLGDLEGARWEAEFVAERLRMRGTAVDVLVGRGADGIAVRARLPFVAHAHFAGHGDSLGAFGWHGTLKLAEGTHLSIPDILALDHVPRSVSLLTCEGGVSAGDPRSQKVALAAAFVLAGADAVFASTSELPADEAIIVAAALYDGLDRDMRTPLNIAYRAAMRRLAAEPVSASTWHSLRLWTP